MIKTVSLTAGTETKVEISGGYNVGVINRTTDMLYASRKSGIVAGADDVAAIPAGDSYVIRAADDTVYLLATAAGDVQLESIGAKEVFKIAATRTSSGGGEGGTVDEVARVAIETHADNTQIHLTAEKAIEAAATVISNPNLLINSWFGKGVINQRGQAEYNTDGYTVDRWTGYSECPIKVVLNDGYISVIPLGGGTGDEYSFTQKLEEIGVLGKTLTFSICAKGSGIAKIGDYYSLKDISLTDQFVVYKHTFVFSDYTNSAIGVWLFGADNQIDTSWIKLELGSVATLFTPPDSATELAKCQRYYQIRTTGDIDPIDLRPSMRTITDIRQREDGNYEYIAEL